MFFDSLDVATMGKSTFQPSVRKLMHLLSTIFHISSSKKFLFTQKRTKTESIRTFFLEMKKKHYQHYYKKQICKSIAVSNVNDNPCHQRKNEKEISQSHLEQNKKEKEKNNLNAFGMRWRGEAIASFVANCFRNQLLFLFLLHDKKNAHTYIHTYIDTTYIRLQSLKRKHIFTFTNIKIMLVHIYKEHNHITTLTYINTHTYPSSPIKNAHTSIHIHQNTHPKTHIYRKYVHKHKKESYNDKSKYIHKI